MRSSSCNTPTSIWSIVANFKSREWALKRVIDLRLGKKHWLCAQWYKVTAVSRWARVQSAKKGVVGILATTTATWCLRMVSHPSLTLINLSPPTLWSETQVLLLIRERANKWSYNNSSNSSNARWDRQASTTSGPCRVCNNRRHSNRTNSSDPWRGSTAREDWTRVVRQQQKR